MPMPVNEAMPVNEGMPVNEVLTGAASLCSGDGGDYTRQHETSA